MSELRLKGGISGYVAEVDKTGRLSTLAISMSTAAQRSFDGDGYNLNTGIITLTDGGESAVYYMKYNGTTRFHVTRIVAAFGVLGGTISDSVEMYIKENPTAGTIVSNATDVDMNGNRNFSSAKELPADVYKGAQGDTLTDGTDILLFFASDNSRSITPVDLILAPGNSLGITVKLNAASGGNLYIAVVGYETEAS